MDIAHLVVHLVMLACMGVFLFRGPVKVDKYLTGWNITAESPCPVVLTVRFGCIPVYCISSARPLSE